MILQVALICSPRSELCKTGKQIAGNATIFDAKEWVGPILVLVSLCKRVSEPQILGHWSQSVATMGQFVPERVAKTGLPPPLHSQYCKPLMKYIKHI
mmetsp:Transcript_38997/g.69819  ORF Transcript_38997/g.69819 Transcript_38997/m.69819 type:complete len:97 (+) Transcript_38997:526-816(+)